MNAEDKFHEELLKSGSPLLVKLYKAFEKELHDSQEVILGKLDKIIKEKEKWEHNVKPRLAPKNTTLADILKTAFGGNNSH